MVLFFMMSAKVATPGLLKIKFFWKKGYGVIISVYAHVNVVMWPKFGNSSISVRKNIITLIL